MDRRQPEGVALTTSVCVHQRSNDRKCRERRLVVRPLQRCGGRKRWIRKGKFAKPAATSPRSRCSCPTERSVGAQICNALILPAKGLESLRKGPARRPATAVVSAFHEGLNIVVALHDGDACELEAQGHFAAARGIKDILARGEGWG